MPPQIRMSDSQEPSSPRRAGEAGQSQSAREQNAHGDDDAATRRQYGDLTSRHGDFVRALERHGSNLTSSDWPILAEDLGWSTEEVQTYAFQYLISLIHRPPRPLGNNISQPSASIRQDHIVDDSGSHVGDHHQSSTMVNGVAAREQPSAPDAATTLPPTSPTATTAELPAATITTTAPAAASAVVTTNVEVAAATTPIRRNRRRRRPWSLEEAVLFDTLVATHMPVEDPEGYDWEEVVAAQLPGRTPTEVRRRWLQLLSRGQRQNPADPRNRPR